MLEALKNFLFPRYCLVCGRWGSWLCFDCVNFVKLNDMRICPMCCEPAFAGLTHPRCRRPLGLDGLTSVFVYKGVIKLAISRFKYQFVSDLSEVLVELFLTFIGEDKAFCSFASQKQVLLTSVPLYWRKKNWRGFNQAELLGRLIAENLGIGFLPDLLIRVKNTKPQMSLSKIQRKKNIKDVFTINKSLTLSHQTPIIIFDDVWTTGLTLKECTKVLKRQGFQKVWGLTLAYHTNDLSKKQ